MVRLENLRRSTRWTIFALLVFLLRVGMVTACAPSDLAELAAYGDNAVVVHSEGVDTGDEDEHGAGHCLHCGCHHAAAMPTGVAPLQALGLTAHFGPPAVPGANCPPKLSLRPPIV